MVTTLSDTVLQHLRDLSFGEASSIDDKLTLLLEAECRRRLALSFTMVGQAGRLYGLV